MKILFLLLVVLLSVSGIAQIQAGQEAGGQTIIEIGLFAEGNEPGQRDSLFLDMNCDEEPDLVITLEIGDPPIDWPHFLVFDCLNPDLSVAFFNDTPYVILWETILFDEGDIIDDSDPTVWGEDWGVAASSGGWFDNGEPLVENKYWGYQLGDSFGWVEISYDLTGNILFLDIPRYLSTCVPDNIPEVELDLTIGPNPVTNREVFLYDTPDIARAELWSMTGKLMQSWEYPNRRLPLDVHPGCYSLVVTDTNGRIMSSPLLVSSD